MLDLVIRGGTVVTPNGVGQWSVGVKDGRIACVVDEGALSLDAPRIVDADGGVVVPGGIDPHVHTNWVIPTAADLGVRSAPPDVVSHAAVYGGTTTLIDFAFVDEDGDLDAAISRKQGEYSGHSFTDFAYHLTFRSSEAVWNAIPQVREAVAAGHVSFKVFTTNTTLSRPRQKTDIGYVWALLQSAAQAGGIVAIHAEDDEIVMYSYRDLERRGLWGYENVHLAHNSLSEELAFKRVLGLAEHSGAPVYLMHISARAGLDALRDARSRGVAAYGETLQHYLSFTAEDYRRPNGAIYHTYPSLKDEDDRQALWEGVADHSISTVATDELCTDLALKVRGKTIDDVTGGHAGVEVRMGLMYTEVVCRRGLGLNRFADVTSANAARIFGMYPQKGAIAPGSDADLVVMRPHSSRPVALADLHETDYSPWEGWRVEAWPETTIVRGVVLVERRKFLGGKPAGQLVNRRLSGEIASRPAC